MKSLSQHLKPLSRDELLDIAERAGVTPRIAVRAQKGIPVSADHYLRLCNSSGFDPVSKDRCTPIALGKFDHTLLALGVNLARRLNKDSIRIAAKKMRIPLIALCRVEKGIPVQIQTTLKACAYVGVHPFHYMACFTGDNRWDSLKSKPTLEAVHGF